MVNYDTYVSVVGWGGLPGKPARRGPEPRLSVAIGPLPTPGQGGFRKGDAVPPFRMGSMVIVVVQTGLAEDGAMGDGLAVVAEVFAAGCTFLVAVGTGDGTAVGT